MIIIAALIILLPVAVFVYYFVKEIQENNEK